MGGDQEESQASQGKRRLGRQPLPNISPKTTRSSTTKKRNATLGCQTNEAITNAVGSKQRKRGADSAENSTTDSQSQSYQSLSPDCAEKWRTKTFTTPEKPSQHEESPVETELSPTVGMMEEFNPKEFTSKIGENTTATSENISTYFEQLPSKLAPSAPASTSVSQLKSNIKVTFHEAENKIASTSKEAVAENDKGADVSPNGPYPSSSSAVVIDAFGDERLETEEYGQVGTNEGSQGRELTNLVTVTDNDYEETFEEPEDSMDVNKDTAEIPNEDLHEEADDEEEDSEETVRPVIATKTSASDLSASRGSLKKESDQEKLKASALCHAKRRKNLAKLVDEHKKSLVENLSLTKKRGQHKYEDHAAVLPDFDDDLVVILRGNSKKAIAEKYMEIAEAIKEDMYLKSGSGNKRYYTRVRNELSLTYHNLDSALLRNNCRRMLKPKITNAELSEDNEEVEELGPKDGKPPRKVTKRESLLPLTKLISKLNREGRKKVGKLEVVTTTVKHTESLGIVKLRETRWKRANIPFEITDDHLEHQTAIIRLEERSDPKLDVEEGYRQTFGLRTKSMISSKARLNDILVVYPLFKWKTFLRIEAEGYLGSRDTVKQYFSNVQLAWKGISSLDNKKTPEKIFEETLAVLGSLIVLFKTESKLVPPNNHKWPYIIHTSQQTLLIYKGTHFLGIDSLKEGLAYLLLLLNMFDMPTTSRPQLLLLLESLFFGYQAPNLSDANKILMNKITDLGSQ